MSKISKYLSLIPKGLSNPGQILEGWLTDAQLNNGLLTSEQEEKILLRRSICASCPYNSTNAITSAEYKELYGKNYKNELDYDHCSICSCPLAKKTSCLSCLCGLTTYNDENPDNFQNLKWT